MLVDGFAARVDAVSSYPITHLYYLPVSSVLFCLDVFRMLSS